MGWHFQIFLAEFQQSIHKGIDLVGGMREEADVDGGIWTQRSMQVSWMSTCVSCTD